MAAGAAAVMLAACSAGHAQGAPPATTTAPATTSAPTVTIGPAATIGPATTTPAPTTTGPPTTTTTVAALPVGDFPAPVAAAFRYLQGRVTVALEGPTSVRTAYNGSQLPDLSATAEAGKSPPQGHTLLTPPAGGYIVGLYYCPAPYPLNDPRMAADCEAAYRTVGGFGAVPQPSPAAAVGARQQLASMPPADPCPAGSPTTDEYGQAVATCGRLPAGSPAPGPAEASWQEGEWSFVYQMGNGATVASATGALIQELKTVALPPYPGWFSVQEGGDGEHTTLAWAVGSTDYTLYDYHSALEGALLASRMRPGR